MLEKIENGLKNNNHIKKVFRFVVGILGAMAFCHTLPTSHLAGRDSVLYSNSTHSFFFVAMASWLYVSIKDKKRQEEGRIWLAALVALFFSAFLVIGAQLESLDNFNAAKGSHYSKILFCALFFHPFIEEAWQFLRQWKEEGLTRKEKAGSRFLPNWLLIFLCWLPVFLAFYPGAFVYDAWEEFEQTRTGNYTTHHPLLHVLLLGKTVLAGEKIFGSYNIGIAIYTILQMILMAGVLSYTLEYIREKIKSGVLEKGILIFYCFFPIFPMYGVCSAKDGLFTTFLLLSVVMFLKFNEDRERFFRKKGNIILIIVSPTLMMLFRNNGIYAYAVWLVAVAGVLILRRKKQKRKIISFCLFFLPLVFSFLTNHALATVLEAQKGGRQEIMTVPIQQMARVHQYEPDTYSAKEKEILYEILPKEELKLYTPRISDLLKSKFDNQAFARDKLKYLSLWVKIGIRKPLIYLNAWGLTSYGYWYPDGVINVYGGNARHTIVYEESSYFGFETEPPGIRESKFPLLEKIYRKISLELFQQKIPAASLFFSPGFLFWSFSFFTAYLCWQKKWQVLLPILLIFLVWLTVILGPTYLVRYVLILWFAFPVVIALLKAGE